MRPAVTVAVTGAGGQLSYSLLFRIASGAMFGTDVPVRLRLQDIEERMQRLEGVVMELEDCAFPLLESMSTTTDIDSVFAGANWALLIGAVPRTPGLERRDLLGVNGKIFGPQGKSINDHAADDVRIIVVGNPCNTNCMIARLHAPDVPADRWFAMTRLDENRAIAMLAAKANVDVTAVSNVAVWGNHSETMYADGLNALIGGQPAPEVIRDEQWLRHGFVEAVAKRGAAVLEARGVSSAASAASALVDSVRTLVEPDYDSNRIACYGVVSRGEYGVPEGLQFGFPIRFLPDQSWHVADGFLLDEIAHYYFQRTVDQLERERAAVASLL